MSSSEAGAKLIKRYSNRKLYDTVESRYVTLDEIAEMVRAGDDVKIIDNRSKEDLTSVTLAQIVFEQEKKFSAMPLGVLRNIVRHGGGSVQDFFEKEIQPRVVSLREGAEHTIEKMFRRDKDGNALDGEGFDHSATSTSSQTSTNNEEKTPDSVQPEKESAAIAKMLFEIRDSIDNWQRCIDYRVQSTMRDAAKLPVRAMNIPGLRKNLASLRQRLEELDKKLADIEEKATDGSNKD